MTTPENFDAFTFRHEGSIYLILCLDITLYWTGSVFDHKKEILNFYNRSMEIVGKDLKLYRTETMRRYREVTAGTLELLPFWLTEPSARRDLYILTMNGSLNAEDASDKAFFLRVNEVKKRGALRLVLPTSWINSASDKLSQLTKELAFEFKFSSGHAGYSFNLSDDIALRSYAQSELYRLGMRYIGIDIPSLTTSLFVVDDGIKSINWLTLVGNQHLERLGSIESLSQMVGDQILIENLQHGVMFQAGPDPEIGDVNRHKILPLYHKIGSALSMIRASEHPPFIVREKLADDDATQAWLSRFDH
jgi:Type VI immunity for VRR-NUC